MSTKDLRSNGISALLFDLDGTLVDTAPDFVAVLNQQRNDFGLDSLPEKDIRNVVSDGARALIKLAFGGNENEPEFQRKRQDLLDRYKVTVGDNAQLFDGMSVVLSRFEEIGIPWGIITNKPRLYTDILLDKLGLSSKSALTLCPDDVSKPKPDPEIMNLASKLLSIDLEKAVYVGDHIRDIQAGKSARMITVAASYGYVNDKNSISGWGADYEIDHPSEIISLFIP